MAEGTEQKVLVGEELRAQQIEQLTATRASSVEVEVGRDILQAEAKRETARLNDLRHAARRLEVALGLAPSAELPSAEDEAADGEGEAAE